ncbi:MAG: hypothetical protein JRG73_12775 [Deltaproteobacteria bacterium]|nr:hypothetical protein [Deltaproteobacteria bacterium]MBW2307794.1 hypothetical protein [Deltaproteobacteria bacterium]
MSTRSRQKTLNCDLGILVSSQRFIEHVVGICRAAAETGRKAVVFLTGPGVLLVEDLCFPELVATGARITVCEVSFIAYGLSKPIPGLKEKDFTNQMQNAEMLDACTRYVVF